MPLLKLYARVNLKYSVFQFPQYGNVETDTPSLPEHPPQVRGTASYFDIKKHHIVGFKYSFKLELANIIAYL